LQVFHIKTPVIRPKIKPAAMKYLPNLRLRAVVLFGFKTAIVVDVQRMADSQ